MLLFYCQKKSDGDDSVSELTVRKLKWKRVGLNELMEFLAAL